MYYVYFDQSGTKILTKTAQDIAGLLKKNVKTIRTLLKSGIYTKNEITVLRFDENEVRKVTRNRKGNQLYKVIPEMFRQAKSNNQNYEE